MTYLLDRHIPRFVGDIYYVDATNGSNDYSGLSPTQAKATITAAITDASAGDAITIKAGTYAENVTVNKASMELWFEIGAVVDPASGTGISVTANNCRITCPDGAVKITPGDTETGVEVTGNFCYMNEIRVACGGAGDCGFDIQGDGCDLRRCRASDVKAAGEATAFKISGDKNKLEDCCTGGNAATKGFYITGSCDKARIKNCGSQGHTSAGFYIDSGCTNAVVEDCYSGGGDGKFINLGYADNCIYSNLSFQGSAKSYNSPITKLVTFTATGGEGGTGNHYRMFKLTGTVRLVDIGGTVTTVIPATNSNLNIELTSSNATVDLSDSGGPNMNSAVVGAVVVRLDVSSAELDLGDPDSTPVVQENTSKFTDRNVVEIIKDDAADTYITLRLSAALASGAMLWACRYEPLTADGFLEPA